MSEANAKLIAAAPLLYEACKAFVDLFEDSDMFPEEDCHELYRQCRAALAAADGD